jgi:hypothetical protein
MKRMTDLTVADPGAESGGDCYALETFGELTQVRENTGDGLHEAYVSMHPEPELPGWWSLILFALPYVVVWLGVLVALFAWLR